MKRISFLGLATALLLFVSISCDDLNNIHQKYLDEGETTYLGRPDSLKTFPGAGRIKLTWYQNADPKIETTVIYWNLRQDSIVRTFDRNSIVGYQKDSVLIEGLDEGSHTFELMNKNRKGEKSLFSIIQGETFGNAYIGRLRVRPIGSIRMEAFDETAKNALVVINWSTPTANCVETIVRYKKYPSGEEVVRRVKSTDTHTELEEAGNRLFHPDDMLYLSSLYLPAGSIDTLYSTELKQQIVAYKPASGSRKEYFSNGQQKEDDDYPPYSLTPDDVKYIWTTMPQENISIMDCDRFGDFQTFPDLFRFTFNADNTVDVSGFSGTSYIISNTGSNSWEPKTVSVYNPVTREFQMIYKRTINSDNEVTIFEETLVPR